MGGDWRCGQARGGAVRWVHHRTRPATAEDPTLTEWQGQALLEIHAAFQAENSAQHLLATDESKKED